MFDALSDALADEQFYAPLATMADPGPRFAPVRTADGWRASERDIWTAWSGPGVRRAGQGWKIHVSARPERAQHVLDVVADTCFAQEAAFKHVSARFFFLALHHKHGARSQAGKFCTVYPPDTAGAERLLVLLAEALDGEEGAYVLSDRRYRDSRTVHYRYGAFAGRSRMLPDGTAQPLVADGHGHDVPDLRLPYFVLPEGVGDPFVDREPAPHRGPIRIRDYEIVKVLQPSNAGGAYQARETRTGRLVLIKEARPHNGYTWDGASARERLRREYETLTAVHAAAAGVCPEPLERFTEWEHDFLVMEHVDGLPLVRWINRSSPVLLADRPAADFDRYHAECRRILASLDAALDRLHALGLRFGDVSPGNVIVTPDGGARLVDFESATALDARPARMGTPGFAPPPGVAAEHPDDPVLADRYGMAALALTLLAPFHNAPQLTPANFALLRRDLAARAPVPDDLWRRATAFRRPGAARPSALPDPGEVDADPVGCLTRLAERTASGLLALADTDRPDWAFPPSPQAFRTNTVCLAYGTAGVVHALLRAGVPVPEEVRERLRHDALTTAHALPPGLAVGSAGVGRTLARTGHLDEAVDLLRAADRHPLTAGTATLAGGRAGVGLAWLALHRQTRDPRHLERAAAAGDAILALGADLGPTLGAHDARGLFHGRSGLALFLHHLTDGTGQPRYRAAGRLLLHEELDRAVELPDGSLSFADNAVNRRVMPYLATGSAGIGTVLLRYAATADERSATALPRVLADVRKVSAVQAGLHDGYGGLVHLLAAHADFTQDDADRRDALRLATGLLKYAVPHGEDVRWLGPGSLRFSADVAGGSAGILLALHRALHGPGDDWFTLDPTHPQESGGNLP
ncbi:Protein kinase domain-containing protein [Streptomyces sp. TLI_053]|uniref:class III lanthionine synthetase LanKC n=1 Tax=Streptomyces sp. TLI_053 TaxID=1855352 RepID=UPI0008798FD8|nr:class III lanthionine synthetase LanKC [Streptomyces sp. TLI_053]SDT83203.1 Protein kinase domain-containing protein [Streptomyces sp. TLI_053]